MLRIVIKGTLWDSFTGELCKVVGTDSFHAIHTDLKQKKLKVCQLI